MSIENAICPICNSKINLDVLKAKELDVFEGKNYNYAHCKSCDVLVLQEPLINDDYQMLIIVKVVTITAS